MKGFLCSFFCSFHKLEILELEVLFFSLCIFLVELVLQSCSNFRSFCSCRILVFCKAKNFVHVVWYFLHI